MEKKPSDVPSYLIVVPEDQVDTILTIANNVTPSILPQATIPHLPYITTTKTHFRILECAA